MSALAFTQDPAHGSAVSDQRVTNDNSLGSYVRYDGGSDATLAACSTSRRQQNEPSVAVDPHNPNVIAAAANDACTAADPAAYPQTPLDRHGWMGYYRSTDGGVHWSDSLVPGYPADQSALGSSSPTHGTCAEGSDPTLAFDRQGQLYYAFICFNLEKPGNGGVYVAEYADDGARYIRTTPLDEGTPGMSGIFNDKPNIAVDQSGGPRDGTVYIAWDRFSGYGVDALVVSRSTDRGRTFSHPVKVSAHSGFGLTYPLFPDVAVGPDGSVYVVYKVPTQQPGGYREALWLARSTDGGRSFGVPVRVADLGDRDFAGGYYSGGSGIYCGDGPFSCNSGLTFSRFQSTPAVAADESGVHVVWNQMLRGSQFGQSKVFVRSSPDGRAGWSEPAVIDGSAVGHQFLPDIASSDGTIDVVFYDSRHDPAYSTDLPPGLTSDGGNSGDVVGTIVAQSADGGLTWSETEASSHRSNFNWELGSTLQLPFFGDYIYISAAAGTVAAAWTSSHDVIPGTDSREPDDPDGFDVYAPCTWNPNDIEAEDFSSPPVADPCFNTGGKDQNVYVARLAPLPRA